MTTAIIFILIALLFFLHLDLDGRVLRQGTNQLDVVKLIAALKKQNQNQDEMITHLIRNLELQSILDVKRTKLMMIQNRN